MSCAIYVRKSTEGEDRQVQSIDDQLTALRSVAKREGINVSIELAEARSAKEPGTRPVFDDLLAKVDTGEIQGILTWSINRLTRNPVDGGRVAYLLQKGRLQFIKTVDRTYLPEDNAILLSVESGMATAFIQDLRKNVLRGMKGKAERGWMPGKAPLGYLNNPLTREIDVDPVRFPLVRQAWDMMLTGNHTVKDVHVALESSGLLTNRRDRRPQGVSRSFVYQLFQNTFYKGCFMHAGVEYQGRHVPMVTPAEFSFVQQNICNRPDRRPKKLKFTYAGLLKCERCGCVCTPERKSKTFKGTNRTVSYVYYHCSGSKGCPKFGVREEDIENHYESVFHRIATPAPFVDWALRAIEGELEKEAETWRVSLTTVHEQIEAEEQRLQQLLELRLNKELTSDEYGTQKQKSTDRIGQLKAVLSQEDGKEELLMRRIREKFDLARRSEEFFTDDQQVKRAMAGGATRSAHLNLSRIKIETDPLIDKIATFEPRKTVSESLKSSDFVPTDPRWYSFVRDVLNLAKSETFAEVERFLAP